MKKTPFDSRKLQGTDANLLAGLVSRIFRGILALLRNPPLRPRRVSLLMLGVVGLGSASAAAPGTPSQKLPWNLEALKNAPVVYPAPEVVVEGLRSLYFAGPSFHGKPTKVFAFYGVPAHSEGQKIPAIVLVHGGGGTAYADWVKLWNTRGYAAIAFDHGGGLPIRNAPGTGWQRHPDSGPSMGECQQLSEGIADQWMYHAVSDAMLATSLLSSFPEVDAGKIGITGISWGGVVTCTVAGLDDRLRYAAPVYGCGFISYDYDDGSRFVGLKQPLEKVQRWKELWDPSLYLSAAKLPMLWVAGTNDFAFTLRALQLSYLGTSAPRTLSTRVRMTHSQRVGSAPEEILAFAESIIHGGIALPQVIKQGVENGVAWTEYKSQTPLVSATLNYTRDGGVWQKRNWETLPAAIDETQHRVSAQLPKDATVWFINLIDNRNLIVSSEHQPLQVPVVNNPSNN
ncbi:MAG: alpha/beta hydrolase family protein [Chthoniobacteraceae bacterium]